MRMGDRKEITRRLICERLSFLYKSHQQKRDVVDEFHPLLSPQREPAPSTNHETFFVRDVNGFLCFVALPYLVAPDYS
jgi:hypothetical protein